ncbi:multicopper oxidase family protein [Pseudaestuariivita rosea]|uniref:multicopper oxidase family protein n=1 Tax=Pseudaestuariivita rosea TaxID=2763263 RepID=UPI001ABB78B0|nr:multicopper oxidase family protein [Pseudaestuariivita rosea]
MRLSRRDVLSGLAASATLPSLSWAATPRVLTATAAQVQLAPQGYPETQIWGYDGQVPGPVLRARQGDLFQVDLVNDLREPTTIHWHGIRLPNAMDGVPGMTQAAVPPGGRFRYEFRVPDAGTYWYHPHFNSVEQISRGLSGVLIVDEAEPSQIDAEHAIVLDDWRLTQEAGFVTPFDHRHDLSHAGRIGNYVTANGQDQLSLTARSGDRLRLRLVNIATARIFDLALSGLRGWVVALDGMPLDAPQQMERLLLAPAQRADIIADVTAASGQEAFLVSVERGEGFAMASITVQGQTDHDLLAVPDPLPPNEMPNLDLGAARVTELVMQGGAMRGMQSARWQGQEMSMRELVQNGQFWSFNGVAGMTDTPLLTAARGETVRIPIQNQTAFPHAMHLHGHHFREVLADGALGPWRDTLLVHADETRHIAFVADNPGDWMFHCHMLSHQMAGMMSWIRVTA